MVKEPKGERPFTLGGMRTPDKTAVFMGGAGVSLTYAELESRANQCAHALRQYGLRCGDAVAICAENSLGFFEIAIAALRSGLTLIPISTVLTSKEIAFIVGDCRARMLIASPGIGRAFDRLPNDVGVEMLVTMGVKSKGFLPWDTIVEQQSKAPISDEKLGREMLYSSGTTGRPKGIVYHGTPDGSGGGIDRSLPVMQKMGFSDSTVYLSPAPLYHTAPFMFSLNVLRLGGTVVAMEKFDPEFALELIERHRIDFAQFVPTHLVRMLKLPTETRMRFDMSSLKLVLHAAAPCPVETKRAMIDWLGPILLEYFGSSEQTVLTMIDSEQWLAHPGSVGRCVLGNLHICDDQGEPLEQGETGTIYSEGGMQFSYLGDPEKSRMAINQYGWTTVGDVGYLDDEGYLYLADRSAFLIITGGVNVYPQEVENLLVTHPKVLDCAVVGVPDLEMGQIVTAVVQPTDIRDATTDFATELQLWLRQSISGVKVPKKIEFWPELPRLPTGKMKKHLVLAKLLENRE